ncbi:hypothetical protein KRM28CT15_15140 [Krasilnikovia sp. M28-CT-15]
MQAGVPGCARSQVPSWSAATARIAWASGQREVLGVLVDGRQVVGQSLNVPGGSVLTARFDAVGDRDAIENRRARPR